MALAKSEMEGCELCPAGMSCTEGVADGATCEIGYYCLEGTSDAHLYLAPPGTQILTTGNDNITDAVGCP